MSEYSDDKLKEIAANILLGQVEDIEYLTVWEVTLDQLELKNPDDLDEDIVRRVDNLIANARVTITFED